MALVVAGGYVSNAVYAATSSNYTVVNNGDKDKKKKGKKNETPELTTSPINTFTTIDVQISKGDMLMQYFKQTVTMDAKDTWIASSGDMKKILRVKP